MASYESILMTTFAILISVFALIRGDASESLCLLRLIGISLLRSVLETKQ